MSCGYKQLEHRSLIMTSSTTDWHVGSTLVVRITTTSVLVTSEGLSSSSTYLNQINHPFLAETPYFASSVTYRVTQPIEHSSRDTITSTNLNSISPSHITMPSTGNGGMASSIKTPATAGIGEDKPKAFDAQGAIGKQFTGMCTSYPYYCIYSRVLIYPILQRREPLAGQPPLSADLWQRMA